MRNPRLLLAIATMVAVVLVTAVGDDTDPSSAADADSTIRSDVDAESAPDPSAVTLLEPAAAPPPVSELDAKIGEINDAQQLSGQMLGLQSDAADQCIGAYVIAEQRPANLPTTGGDCVLAPLLMSDGEWARDDPCVAHIASSAGAITVARDIDRASDVIGADLYIVSDAVRLAEIETNLAETIGRDSSGNFGGFGDALRRSVSLRLRVEADCAAGATSEPATPTTEAITPVVDVAVVNSTGAAGLAGQWRTSIATVAGIETTDHNGRDTQGVWFCEETSVIYHRAGFASTARAVADQLSPIGALPSVEGDADTWTRLAAGAPTLRVDDTEVIVVVGRDLAPDEFEECDG